MKPTALVRDVADRLRPFASLFLRLGVGLVFLQHGLMKAHMGVAGVAGFFGHLGIPLPSVSAAVVIAVETVGAVCLLLGLLTRFWAACMVVDMAVAILVAVLPSHQSFEIEGLLLASALALFALGAGPLSIDRLLDKKGG